MNKRSILFLLLVLFLFPIKVSAQCSSERLAELNKIAENINLSYTYEVSNDEALFKVTASNLTSDIYLVSEEEGITVHGVNDKTVDKEFASGTNLNFVVYSNDKNCPNEPLTNKYITLPYYNVYSAYGVCKEYPEHEYCKRWYDSSKISRSDFERALADYSDKLMDDEIETKKVKDESFLDSMKDIWNKYSLFIIIGMAVILIIIIIFLIKIRKNRKSSLL